MTLQKIFIENLKFFRKQKKMTQNELTLALNKSYNYINGVEQGKYFPPPDVIEEIANILGIKPVQLFDEKSNTNTYLSVNRSELVQEITNNVCAKLKTDFQSEMSKYFE